MLNATLQKLLVPIDYSDTSLNALDLAVAMSRRHDAEIRLLHVINPGQYLFAWSNGAQTDPSKEAVISTETQKLQKLAETIAADAYVRCAYTCRTGVVCETIVETAREFDADFIVMGTHGTSGIREYFMGSEAYRVIKTASCPVLTVPNNQPWTDFNEIVFPVRPVPGALDKYEVARKIIRKNNAHLTVLGLLDGEDDQKIETLNQAIASLRDQLSQDEVNSDTLLLQTDSIAKTVLEKAADLRADLIVITADLDTTVQHFFVGPFAQQIVNRATVPVLSIRPQPFMVLRMQPVNETAWPEIPTLQNLFPPLQLT